MRNLFDSVIKDKSNMSSTTRIITLFVSLAALSATSFAQEKKGTWYGSVELSGGSNFQRDDLTKNFSNSAGDASLKFGYKTPKFFINLSGSAHSNYNTTNKTGCSFNLNEGKEKLAIDLTVPEKTTASGDFQIDGGVNLSANDRLSFKLSQSISHTSPSNITVTLDFLKDDEALQFTQENGNTDLNIYKSSVKWEHNFNKPGRKLDMEAAFRYDEDERCTIWERGWGIIDENMEPVGEVIDKVYRITPFYVDNYFNFTSRYSDSNFASIDKLNMIFGLDLQLKKDVDKYSAANQIKEEWIDSVRYRESFDYLSLKIDPRIDGSYKTRHFNFKVLFIPEIFSDRLNDAEHIARLEKATVSPIGNFKIDWNANKHHMVSLNFDRAITRPDYLQMCWFQRPGAYSNELMEGNVDLKPCSSNSIVLMYKYSLHKFSVSAEYRSKYMENMIEKTYRNEDIDGRHYRVYTWINSGYSYTNSASVQARYDGNKLKAELRGIINWFYGVNNNNNVRKSNDYEIRGRCEYDFGKGFYAWVSGRYTSKIIRNYTSTTAYVALDARVGKRFKHWELYLDGRDLLENELKTETYSEDFNEGRYELLNLNRRCIRLGVKFSF